MSNWALLRVTEHLFGANLLRVQPLRNQFEAAKLENVLTTYESMMARYLEQRRKLSPRQIVDVRFEKLFENPRTELRRIYRVLDLGSCPPDASPLTKGYVRNTYDIPADLAALIRNRTSAVAAELERLTE